MIYSVTVKRMQEWKCRVKAASEDDAKSIAEQLTEDWPASDDYGYETTARPAKDQETEPDNV